MLKIGWIGLGNMGIPMSKRLLSAGYPLFIYNRNVAKTVELSGLGAKNSKSITSLVDQADVIFIMVSDDSAIKDIFNSRKGIFASDSREKIFINMSTVSPEISKKIAITCEEKGNKYLDAPVSGSVKQAEDGLLAIMVGGKIDTYKKVEPLFSVLGKISILVGAIGAGNVAKLAINTLLAIHAQGLAEALVFAEKQGITKTNIMELLNNSALGNTFMKIKGEAIVNQNYKAVFSLKHIAKDLRLAKNEGINSPLANTVHQSFQEAESALANEDIISIVKCFV